ncbi:MAG: tetratricopeptide repeat protein [Anaerolineales bacterium]|nr:tetratricopeptide repeat protein [Anaerolineales bacterium]
MVSKWSIANPTLEEQSASRMTISSSGGMRLLRLTMILMMIVGGLLILLLGLIGQDVPFTLGSVLICLVPALISSVALPLTIKVIFEKQMSRMVLTRQQLIGFSRWPRKRETVVNISDIQDVAYKAYWTGSSHFVEISTSVGETVSMQFGPKVNDAHQMVQKLRSWIDPESRILTPPTSEDMVEPPPPFSIERFGLAAVYGMIVALLLGHIWSMVVMATETKYAMAALLIGLAMGVVVNFIAGGNKDNRYAALGALLSGVSIVFGEFLIFGNPASEYIYQFEAIDLLFYALAVYEGWALVRRPIPAAARFRHLIHEDNRIPLLAAGLGGLLLVLWVSAVSGVLPTPGGASAKFHFDRGVSLVQEGDLEESIAEFEQAIRIQPDYALAYHTLGVAYYETRRLEEAKVAFENAIQHDPDLATAHAWLGNVYNEYGLYQRGLEEVDEALRLDPALPEGHLFKGYILLNLSRIDDAQAAFEKTLALDPEFAEAHLMLSLLYFERDDFTQALAHIDQALEIDTVEAFDAYAHYWRGLIHIETEQTDIAITELETSLEMGLEPILAEQARFILEELRK